MFLEWLSAEEALNEEKPCIHRIVNVVVSCLHDVLLSVRESYSITVQEASHA